MAFDAFSDVITDEAVLRAHYRAPHPVVAAKKVDRIDPVTASYIATVPLVFLSTADADGRCTTSPRGGQPGFVRVLGPRHLAIPDFAGNNLLDALADIVANPFVGLLLVVPGTQDCLRINGSACITTSPELLGELAAEGRAPVAAIGIEVHEVFVHCPRAFHRARVWDPQSWQAHDPPGLKELIAEHLAAKGVALPDDDDD